MLLALDIDDTLYLERDYVRSGFDATGHWLSKHGIMKDFAEKAWSLFERGERGKIFNQVLASQRIDDPNLIQKLVSVYREHHPCISLLPDAEAFLDANSFHTFAVISDGYLIAQKRKVVALGLHKRVESIILTDQWGRDCWKPNPKAFIEVMANRPPHECAYIGDNPQKDFVAPYNLGWGHLYRINRPASMHEHSVTPPYCREVKSFDQIYLG